MSVAEWDGVPLAEVVTNLRTRLPSTPVSLSESLTPGESRATGVWGVLIAGLDDESNTSRQSIPGASWVFPLDQLLSLGAFLAVRMNGEPLPPDHGAPVRLVVPGWYGCTWIKWVNEIQLVGRDHPATSQMREFARRTHQNGVPALARDYEPPVIDLAATPIRVEKRRVDGHLEYRVVGIVWGGSRPTDRLLIRFHSRDSFKPLTICPPPGTTAMWALWEYRWRPTSAGIYDIVLKAADPTIRTRRLDLFYYLRRVQIDEI